MNAKKQRIIKVGIVALGVAVAGIAIAIPIYWPEVMMSKNERLSVEFSESYKGQEFDAIRVKCAGGRAFRTMYQDWQLEMHIDSKLVEAERLGNSNFNPCFSQDARFVIKPNKSGIGGYSVWTSGEEKTTVYTPRFLSVMISTVELAFSVDEDERKIKADWSVK